mgnify:CR=1 FL=1
MNKYEITIITREDEKEKPVKKEIESLGGRVLEANSIGQRQLVFPIKKEVAGYYTVVIFELEPTKILELNKKLGLSPEILRHLILVAKAAKIEAPKEKAAVSKEEKVEEKEVIPTLPPEGAGKEKPEVIEKVEEAKKAEEKPIEKPEAKEKTTKKPIKKTKEKPEAGPKVSPATKEIETEEISADERLKALDKKLDELLKE